MTFRLHDPERLFDLDLVRCTENGALAASKWIGKGNKNAADQAASDAIRGMFRLIDCQGIVRIGEGLKDEAPGIFTGEKLGSWKPGSPRVAVAVDPIDGTTPLAKGLNSSISVLAVATCDDPAQDPRDLFPNVPSHYMEKLAVGPRLMAAGAAVNLDAPLPRNLKIIAAALNKRVSDLVAVVLDRPRHERIISCLRSKLRHPLDPRRRRGRGHCSVSAEFSSRFVRRHGRQPRSGSRRLSDQVPGWRVAVSYVSQRRSRTATFDRKAWVPAGRD